MKVKITTMRDIIVEVPKDFQVPLLQAWAFQNDVITSYPDREIEKVVKWAEDNLQGDVVAISACDGFDTPLWEA